MRITAAPSPLAAARLARRSIALYGRFSAGERDAFSRAIVAAGGATSRDLMRRSDMFVVGALATPLASGALQARIASARARGTPVISERRFAALLAGRALEPTDAVFPLTSALSQTRVTRADAEALAGFDLIVLDKECCRFGDVATLRTAGDLLGAGCSLPAAIRILIAARDHAPAGRRRVVMTPTGPALQWDDGLTTLDGQGYLPLADDLTDIDALFDAALLAETEADLDEAARLFDLCARAERKDPTAPYNLANIRLRQERFEEASLGYRRALERDPHFAEARYNLAQALEALGRTEDAAAELALALEYDPDHADALFNLAQLRMKAGAMADAQDLYVRYLSHDPPSDWAEKARRALAYCRAAQRA